MKLPLPLQRSLLLIAIAALAACASTHSPRPSQSSEAAIGAGPVPVRLLALNDFHGQITTGRRLGTRPAGGAAVLSSYLHDAMRGAEDHTLIVDAGDMVGASALASSLLHDEPTIMFLNQLGNEHCKAADRLDPHCNMVGTLGNHEFDKGLPELLRVQTGKGGNAKEGPFLQDKWLGANFPVVSANVVWKESGTPVLPPYVIKYVPYTNPKTGANGEVPIAFIGATVRGTPSLTSPSNVADVKFLDEADAVNRYIPEIHAQGVHAIVLLIHEGGMQKPYDGITDMAQAPVEGTIVNIVKRLNDDIGIVCSGHTHAFTNTMLPNASGKPVLVTQALSYSTAFAEIDLSIEPTNDQIVSKAARIIGTYGDEGPGLNPDPQVADLVARAETKVAAIADRPIARIEQEINRETTANGESNLGNVVADAQRAFAGTDFAFTNAGGLRDDLRKNAAAGSQPEGMVRYKDVYAAQPFNNAVVKMTLTGQQIYDLLDQQFSPYRKAEKDRPSLFVSGLSYSWDPQSADHKVVDVRKDGKSIDRDKQYTIAVSNFLADGGDRFTVLKDGKNRTVIGLDVDALVQYMHDSAQHHDGVFTPPALGQRVTSLH